MSGQVIYEPPESHVCEGAPQGKENGTRWRCDDCGATWIHARGVLGGRWFRETTGERVRRWLRGWGR